MPGTWAFGCDGSGPDAIGRLGWKYGNGIACDDGGIWPGWPDIGGKYCADWGKWDIWVWPLGMATFGPDIPCPTGRNCWEGTNWFVCGGNSGVNCIIHKIQSRLIK